MYRLMYEDLSKPELIEYSRLGPMVYFKIATMFLSLISSNACGGYSKTRIQFVKNAKSIQLIFPNTATNISFGSF